LKTGSSRLPRVDDGNITQPRGFRQIGSGLRLDFDSVTHARESLEE
jgi:hypothetical protein